MSLRPGPRITYPNQESFRQTKPGEMDFREEKFAYQYQSPPKHFGEKSPVRMILLIPEKSKRGREEGDGTENVINCRKLLQIVVTFYGEFVTIYDVLSQWNKETEIVIKCRKLPSNGRLFFPSPSRRPLLVFADKPKKGQSVHEVSAGANLGNVSSATTTTESLIWWINRWAAWQHQGMQMLHQMSFWVGVVALLLVLKIWTKFLCELRKEKHPSSQKKVKFMNFSFWPLCWFGLLGRLLTKGPFRTKNAAAFESVGFLLPPQFFIVCTFSSFSIANKPIWALSLLFCYRRSECSPRTEFSPCSIFGTEGSFG